ncbi:Uncharacterized protein Adt_30998 [Abeliophyllum distichum]|uniref:Uncharacterized protein n=1 Tax=Abeliophyllum distichum TaxID=126358 RepID=A0ABD1RCU4_9LAMI
MLLRTLRRATTAAASAASSSTLTKQHHSHLSISRSFSSNTTKANLTKAKRSKSKSDGKDRAEELQVTDTEFFVKQDEELRRQQLAQDENNPALDMGPNGRPLFTSTSSISLLTKKDASTYMKFRHDLN